MAERTTTLRKGPGPAHPRRRVTGSAGTLLAVAQFAPSQSLIEPVEVVRAVTLWAQPDAPSECSTRTYDETRGPTGYPDAITAKATAARA